MSVGMLKANNRTVEEIQKMHPLVHADGWSVQENLLHEHE